MPTPFERIRHLFALCALIFVLSPCALADEGKTDNPRDYKFVLVIDVSPSLRAQKDIINGLVACIYDSVYHPPQDELNIITFSDKARIIDTRQNKASVLKTIEAALLQKGERTLPAVGLLKVFDLIGDGFPEKIGAVIFISDGENSDGPYRQDETQKVVGSLRNSGFNFFNIYISTDTRYSDRPFMAQMAAWSRSKLYEIEQPRDVQIVLGRLKNDLAQATYSSPIAYQEFLKIKSRLNEGFKQELDAAYRDMNARLQQELAAMKAQWPQPVDTTPGSGRMPVLYVLSLLSIVAGGLFFMRLRRPASKREVSAVSAAEPLWGVLVHADTGQRFNLSAKKGGETFHPKDKQQQLQIVLEFQKNQKVMRINADREITYLDAEQQILPYGFISDTTRFIRCEDSKGGRDVFAYQFLDTLKAGPAQPACTKESFFGRKELLDQMNLNFLQAPEDISHYLIYAMANSGKTSLLKYFHQVVWPESLRLKKRYYVYLIEFNQYKDICAGDLVHIIPDDQKEKIVMIDEYDNFIQRFPDDFLNWINALHKTQPVYFIFAGRKSAYFLTEREKALLPGNLEETALHGLDDVSRLSAGNSNSLQFINSILTSIGFHSKFISEAVKIKIAEYTNGIPYLIKRILHTLISDWIHREDFYVISLDDLEKTIPKMIGIEKFNSIIKACSNDETNSVFSRDLSEAILLKGILNVLSTQGRGRLPKTDLIEMLKGTTDRMNHPITPTMIDNSLEKIKSMGFVMERNGVINGTPHLFFYDGEYLL